jgi:predicted anti-sigma-YlaC factor YlaD
MSTCDDLFDAYKDYLDGDAKEEVCCEVDAHLRECPSCRVHINTLNGTIELYKSVGGKKMPREARERLHRALKIKPEWLKDSEKD